MPDATSPDPPAAETGTIAAATVVLGRTARGGLEVLMLRRAPSLKFAGGMWVFPGGRIDDADRAGGDDLADVTAAARETREEAGLDIEVGQLVRWSHWTPPQRPEVTHRFSTAFFVAPAPDGEVVIDGGEIVDHRWQAPEEVLADHGGGAIELAPPTFLTLLQLREVNGVDDMLRRARTGPVEHFATRIVMVGDAVFALYHGDAGYESADASAAGPRHRIHLHERPWRYERD